MQGFVMLMMLVYLQVFALLAMQGAAAVLGQRQQLRDGIISYEMRQHMLQLMNLIDHRIHVNCEIKPVSYLQLMSASREWWRQHGCLASSNGRHLVFIREKIGVDPCGLISSSLHHQPGVVYYRHSLIQLNESQIESPILQDTVALSDSSLLPCRQDIKKITPGRQMLRWI